VSQSYAAVGDIEDVQQGDGRVQDTLRIEHLSKTFPGQAALIDVDLTVAPGEVHALVGQNGSGKSTLIKILAGYHQPDEGGMAWVDGEELTLGDGQAASAAGIRFVHQDLGLVGSISTVENMSLAVGYMTGPGGRIRWRAERKRAREALDAIGAHGIDVRAAVDTLAPSQRTAVAIACALLNWEDGAKLLVLDEPTATLPGDDVNKLFEIIHRLRARGVSILYVSHHLDEVFELADTVTVLRDARKVTTTSVASLDNSGLIELIVGHHVETLDASDDPTSGKPVLTVRGLSGATVKGIDLNIHEGEIVGLAGITGSGREHVLALIAGQEPRVDGEVLIQGAPVDNYSPRDVIERGGAFVPAERTTRGVVGTMNVRENMSLSTLGQFFRRMWLSRRGEVNATHDWIDRLSVKTSSTESPIGSLSGGNQQKVVFGKALALKPRLLLLDEPTQGIDIGAKEQIHRLVDQASADGVATLVASTDTDELVRLCHRVVVMVDGHVATRFVGADITTEKIEHTQLQSSRRTS